MNFQYRNGELIRFEDYSTPPHQDGDRAIRIRRRKAALWKMNLSYFLAKVRSKSDDKMIRDTPEHYYWNERFS
jgi:hypothetical protein